MMVRERVSVLLLLALMSCGNEIARSDRGSVPVVSTVAPMPSSTTPSSDSSVAPLSTREIEADYERHNSIDELIASAQLIVVGSVVDVESLGRPSMNEDPNAEEYAAFTIHVDEQLMGDPVNEVTLAWDSYVVDDNGERIGEVVMNGVPVPRMGDTMLLFLQTADPAFAAFLGGVPTHQPVGLDGVVYIRSGVAADGDVTSPASAQIEGWTLDELRNAVSAATTEPANGADLDLLTMPPSFFTIAPCARLIEDLGTAGLEADVFPDYFYADLEDAIEQSDAIATASVVSIEQSVVITPTGMTPGQVTDTGAGTVGDLAWAETIVRMRVDEVLAGTPPAEMVVFTMGCLAEGAAASVTPGQRLLVFTDDMPADNGPYRSLGVNQWRLDWYEIDEIDVLHPVADAMGLQPRLPELSGSSLDDIVADIRELAQSRSAIPNSPAPSGVPSPDLGLVGDEAALVAALVASGPLDNQLLSDAGMRPSVSICADIVQHHEPTVGTLVHQALATFNGQVGVVLVFERPGGAREVRLYGTGDADPVTGGCPLLLQAPL